MAAATAFFLLAFSLSEGCAMGLSSRLVLFSDVHGTVLNHGKPVQGAELLQEVVWSDDKSDVPPKQAHTDAEGRFHFPPVEHAAGMTRAVPHQPVILQKIIIRYEGVDYVAWRHTRNSYEANSELEGKPLQLECELTRQPDFEGTHYGICKAI
jgi:hypothetical protein